MLLLAVCILALLLRPPAARTHDKDKDTGSQQKAVEAARAEERARQAEVRADELARQLTEERQAQREREDARAADSSAAWTVAFAAAAAAVLLAMLLLHELRSRRALSWVLRWLTGRHRP